jgi:hypothetical protein
MRLGCAKLTFSSVNVSTLYVLHVGSLRPSRLMSPTARLTATFVPLLSPPLRISVQTLRWLTRRPPLGRPLSSQCRSLHLYKTARAKTMHGMHGVLGFEQYSPPALAESDHTINIVKLVNSHDRGQVDSQESDKAQHEGEGKIQKIVVEGLTLEQVWRDYIEPGKILRLAHTVPRVDAPPDYQTMEARKTVQRFRDFAIVEAFSTGAEAQVGGKKAHKARGNLAEIAHQQSLREVTLQLQTPMHHFAMMMDKAYQFIHLGSPVEFNICVRHVTDKKAAHKFGDSAPIESLNYVYKHFPHLRPDFILKSMPPGTTFIIEPFSNGRRVQFVLGLTFAATGPRLGNLTKRLLKVKKAVINAINEGRVSQLPRRVRSMRDQQGDEKDSLTTGISKETVEQASGETPRWASEPPRHIPEDKRKLWAEWTAGGSDNSKRYVVPRAKDMFTAPGGSRSDDLKEMDRRKWKTMKLEETMKKRVGEGRKVRGGDV